MRYFVALFVFITACLYGCPFCDPEIISKQQVYHSNFWRVLVDHKPIQDGHLLLVPIVHKLTRHELSLEEVIDLYYVEKLVRQVLIDRFGNAIEDLQYEKNGTTLQSVNHFHIHVVPIREAMSGVLGKIQLAWRLFIYRPALSQEQIEKEKELFTSLFQHAEIEQQAL